MKFFRQILTGVNFFGKFWPGWIFFGKFWKLYPPKHPCLTHPVEVENPPGSPRWKPFLNSPGWKFSGKFWPGWKMIPPPPRPRDIQPVVTGGNFYRIINHPYLENGSLKEKIKANSRTWNFAMIILSGNIIGLAPLFIYQPVLVKKASFFIALTD